MTNRLIRSTARGLHQSTPPPRIVANFFKVRVSRCSMKNKLLTSNLILALCRPVINIKYRQSIVRMSSS